MIKWNKFIEKNYSNKDLLPNASYWIRIYEGDYQVLSFLIFKFEFSSDMTLLKMSLNELMYSPSLSGTH